jgi:alkylated DNA nucleotide flippase Atl1
MDSPSFLDKLLQAPPASLHVLDAAKAARMKANTMVIPAATDVAQVIANIPSGQTITYLALRTALAARGQADTACPMVTTRYWTWLAAAAQEPRTARTAFAVPWWRVIKPGKPSAQLPTGAQGQAALLLAEGVRLR